MRYRLGSDIPFGLGTSFKVRPWRYKLQLLAMRETGGENLGVWIIVELDLISFIQSKRFDHHAGDDNPLGVAYFGDFGDH